jgi:hypothetical protein
MTPSIAVLRFLTAVSATLLLVTAAAVKAETPPANNGANNNNKVPAELFMQIMAASAPKLLCNNEQGPLRRCLKLNLEKCMAEVTNVTPGCVKEVQAEMPAVLESREQGGLYGGKLGRCIASRILASNPTYLQLVQNCNTN